MSTDHPATTFINFFPKKYLLAVYKDIMVIPVLLHCVLGKQLVKIDELGPNGSHYNQISQGAGLLFKSSLPGQYFCCISVVYTIAFRVCKPVLF